jgi:ElaB/YqjD/DUF883 family membrane-anchored ribosome-binding protein
MTQPLHPDIPGGGASSTGPSGGTTEPAVDPLTDPLPPSTADELNVPGDDVLGGGAAYGTSGAGSSGTGSSGGSGSSTTDVAKEQAGEVTQSAKEAGAQVASTAKEQAGQVASEAKDQAKDLLHRSRGELQDQASQQQQRAAQGLRTLGDQLGQMAEQSDQDGLARDLTRQVADRASSAATWLEDRDPGSLLEEVRSFARQRPMAFLAISAGAGLLVGRLGRGAQAASSGGSSGSTGTTPGAVDYTASGTGYASTTTAAGADVDLTSTDAEYGTDAGYTAGTTSGGLGGASTRPFTTGSDTGGRP